MTVTKTTTTARPRPITFDDVCTYLARERRLCDELPLAKPKADARRIPRMQNVFVELRTTLPVDEATWFDRLGVAPGRQAEAAPAAGAAGWRRARSAQRSRR